MKVIHEYVKIKRKVVNPNVGDDIAAKTNEVQTISSAIQQMEQLIKEFNDELETIQAISIKFAHFLNQNAFLVNRFFNVIYCQLIGCLFFAML